MLRRVGEDLRTAPEVRPPSIAVAQHLHDLLYRSPRSLEDGHRHARRLHTAVLGRRLHLLEHEPRRRRAGLFLATAIKHRVEPAEILEVLLQPLLQQLVIRNGLLWDRQVERRARLDAFARDALKGGELMIEIRRHRLVLASAVAHLAQVGFCAEGDHRVQALPRVLTLDAMLLPPVVEGVGSLQQVDRTEHLRTELCEVLELSLERRAAPKLVGQKVAPRLDLASDLGAVARRRLNGLELDEHLAHLMREAIGGHQRSSAVIRGDIRGDIRGHQRSSAAIR